MKKIVWTMALIGIILFLNAGHLLAAIPASERAALIELYNSTDGDNWTNNFGWKTPPLDADGFAMPGTEDTWIGVTSHNDHIWKVFLPRNNLKGTIPAAIGDLAELTHLYLYRNQLTGPLPVELANATKLYCISVYANKLSGNIPAALGNLTNLTWLCLDGNKFTGSIPAELGNLGSLIVLYLDGNNLSGSIPSSLKNLTLLRDNGSTFGWNALYTNDDALRAFLNQKQEYGDWECNQTIAPTNLTAEIVTSTSVLVSWDPIRFTNSGGGYRVFCSTSSGGAYTEFGMTADKNVSSMTVTGLTPGKTYYFMVKTQTNAHGSNSNTVVSEQSAEVSLPLPLDPVKFNATPLVVGPGKEILFTNNSGGEVNRFLWDFGDGSREGYRHGTMSGQKVHPNHTYTEAGDYTITLTAFGWGDNPPITLTMPDLICIDPNYAPLTVVAGSETHDGCGWTKTLDQDVFSKEGKMNADLPNVECVYAFADNSIRNVERVRLFIDDVYQRSFSGHLTGKFEVWVSVDNESWTQALATEIPWHYRGQFASFTFPPVLGRYVKLKLIEPHNSNAEIIQLTEFQVFGAKNGDTPFEKGLLADNTPITEYKLAQNYPNPFNPTTTIRFALPVAEHVRLDVFNVRGQLVAKLLDQEVPAGHYAYTFDAADLNSGMYYYRIQTHDFQKMKRMMYLK